MFQSFGVGRLGGDPEMRYTASGTAVTNFSIATETGYGDYKQKVWLRATVFGGLAEACNQYLKKGQEVTFVGEIQVDKETCAPKVYEKRDGGWASSLDIKLSEIKFHGGGKGEGVDF